MTRQCERLSCNKPAETKLVNEQEHQFFFCADCATIKLDQFDDLTEADDAHGQ